jgi:hypothetical protein
MACQNCQSCKGGACGGAAGLQDAQKQKNSTEDFQQLVAQMLNQAQQSAAAQQ